MAQMIGWRVTLSLYRSLKGVSLRQKLGLLRRKLRGPGQSRLARIRRRMQTGHIGAAFRLLGPSAGIKAFWKSPFAARTWYDVHRRLEWLDTHYPDYVGVFVSTAVVETKDANTLIGLAQSPLSDTDLRPHLALIDNKPPKAFLARMENSQVFAAAYVGAVMLLCGPEVAQTADRFVRNTHRLPRFNYDRFLDSLSFCPDTDVVQRSFESGYCAPKQHRLLILESAKSIDDYKHLMRDATSVTVIDMTDLYGKTNFEDVKIRGVETIQIEHVRTRITRFCPAYHTLHTQTKEAATQIMQALAQLQSDNAMLFGQASPHLTLDLADGLFFEALKLRALETLVANPAFDHIVIAHQSGPNRPYDRLLSCLPALACDPRVEFVSTARGLSQRLAARQTILTATHTPEVLSRQIPPLDISDIHQDMWRKLRARVDALDPLPDDDRPRLLLLAGHNPAYNPSTVATMSALAQDYQITAIFAGGALSSVLRGSAAAQDAIQQVTPITISHRLLPNLSDLSRWLQYHMQAAAQDLTQVDLRHVATAFTGQIVRNALLPGVADYAFMKGWMERLQRDGQLPALALVTPQRSAKLGTLSEAARDFGIPSLALEPHGLNGNYCRYSKVMMDYYGVISDYFRNSAESDFGISKTRCRVIGSPRIIAPADYDPAAAKIAARASLKETQQVTFQTGRHYGSFFCQPSQWAHTSKVWSNLLRATQGMNITLLLKTHPEESKARVTRYLTIAAEMGALDRVIYIEGDPNTIIEASDVVMTGYSASAIDAAVLQKPTLCITADHAPYPVDQHTIVHSTLCGDVQTLEQELTLLLSNPDEAARRARAFLEAEPQFVTGPDDYLRGFVADILKLPRDEALRPDDQRPATLFLDGPFTPFNV